MGINLDNGTEQIPQPEEIEENPENEQAICSQLLRLLESEFAYLGFSFQDVEGAFNHECHPKDPYQRQWTSEDLEKLQERNWIRWEELANQYFITDEGFKAARTIC